MWKEATPHFQLHVGPFLIVSVVYDRYTGLAGVGRSSAEPHVISTTRDITTGECSTRPSRTANISLVMGIGRQTASQKLTQPRVGLCLSQQKNQPGFSLPSPPVLSHVIFSLCDAKMLRFHKLRLFVTVTNNKDVSLQGRLINAIFQHHQGIDSWRDFNVT